LTAVFRIEGRLSAATIPALCDRLVSILSSTPAEVIICDLAALQTCDLTTVDGLARLQLTARRYGRCIQLRSTPQPLTALIKLCGLDQDLLAASEPHRRNRQDL
jgi:ABC-type transporter Mla MlaB component